MSDWLIAVSFLELLWHHLQLLLVCLLSAFSFVLITVKHAVLVWNQATDFVIVKYSIYLLWNSWFAFAFCFGLLSFYRAKNVLAERVLPAVTWSVKTSVLVPLAAVHVHTCPCHNTTSTMLDRYCLMLQIVSRFPPPCFLPPIILIQDHLHFICQISLLWLCAVTLFDVSGVNNSRKL